MVQQFFLSTTFSSYIVDFEATRALGNRFSIGKAAVKKLNVRERVAKIGAICCTPTLLSKKNHKFYKYVFIIYEKCYRKTIVLLRKY